MRRTTRSELFTGRVYGFVPESVLSCDREDPTELALFAAFFAMLGLCVLVIGAHDFSISSASFGLTLVSLALVAFGIILVVAVQHLAALALGWGCDSQTTTLPECKTRVLVACGSTYSLTGSRVVACHRQPTPEKLQQFFAKFNVDRHAALHDGCVGSATGCVARRGQVRRRRQASGRERPRHAPARLLRSA
jgi:hypothetical protein